LKVLPPQLKYSFLDGDIKKPVILSNLLTVDEEKQVIEVLKKSTKRLLVGNCQT